MKTIVHILSTNYAGSHYLSLLLGSHSRAAHLGEIKRLRKLRGKERDEYCRLCGSLDACPVFKGVSPETIDRVYDIVAANLGPQKEALIDTSKKTFWTEKFLGDPRYKVKVIHLVRDPRALVRRWALTYGKSGSEGAIRWRTGRDYWQRALPIFLGKMEDVYLYRWLLQNREITRFIRKTGVEHRVVTYYDLITDLPRVVRELTEFMGLKFEPAQLEPERFQHHGTQKIEGWAKEKKAGESLDLRWKEFLTPAAQEKIVGNRLVNRYLRRLDLRFISDGVTAQRG